MSTDLIRRYIDMLNEAHIAAGGHLSKLEANYTDNSPYTNKCRDCKHFIEPSRCEIVIGIIEEDGWCKYFSGYLGEKWGTETNVSPQEKGKYSGKTKAELLHSYNELKKSGPHHRGSPEFGRMRELAFAIRAKGGWGKVK